VEGIWLPSASYARVQKVNQPRSDEQLVGVEVDTQSLCRIIAQGVYQISTFRLRPQGNVLGREEIMQASLKDAI